jgi:carbonic anhydrase
MFITCADSRVSPGLLMGAHPGDLFIVRCIGALVPPARAAAMPQEGAAVEYGVGVLGVRHVVVCGHSKCGAIGALKKGKVPAELVTLEVWAKLATAMAGDLEVYADADEAARAVTVRQLENLMTYPLVRDRVAKGELQLHAWFYDLGAVELYEWDPARQRFAVLGADPRPTSIPPPPPDAIDVAIPESPPPPDDA